MTLKTPIKTPRTLRATKIPARAKAEITRVPLDDGWNDLAPVSARQAIAGKPAAKASPVSQELAGRRVPIRTRKPATTRLYLAYGSNLNVAQMRWRCPAAVKIGVTAIPDTRLIFRGVADIEPATGCSVPVGVWRVTRECERALDAYEGYRPGDDGRAGLYRREWLPIRFTLADGTLIDDRALVYVMNRGGYGMPGDYYLRTIARGYKDFGIDSAALEQALTDTYHAQRDKVA